MVAAEQNQERRCGRRHTKQPGVREGVGPEVSFAIERTDQVLFLLIVAVDDGKVDIRRSLVDAFTGILLVCIEDLCPGNSVQCKWGIDLIKAYLMDDQVGEREEKAGETRRMIDFSLPLQ